MGTNNADIDSLEEKVQSRQKLITQFVKFAETLLIKHGRVLERHEGSCHTNTIAMLAKFNNFSFWGNLGQSMMGGNTIKIWYQDHLVLEVYYAASVEECQVRTFENNIDWVPELKKAESQKEQILAQMKKQEAEAKREKQQALSDEAKIKKLKEDAKRLGLNL